MKTLVLQPTDLAQWHTLVHEAQLASHSRLDEVLESYLVFMLMRFCDQPQLVSKVMAMEFLEAQGSSEQQPARLRDVGDQCLLFSGLFPQLAERRLVRISYFVGIGRSAYDQLAQLVDRHSDRLYARLAEAFVAVMDVLQAMRGLSGDAVLQPLAAAELWVDTGGRMARQTLDDISEVSTVVSGNSSKH